MSKLETNTIDTVSGTTNLTIGGANNTGTTTIKSNNTAAITVDSSQNVGIGTTSPTRLLTVENSSGNSNFCVKASNTGVSQVMFGDSDSDVIGNIAYNHTGNYMYTEVNGSEIMRMANGDVMIGTTTTYDQSRLTVNADSGSYVPLTVRVGLVSNGFTGVFFKNPNGTVGSIAVNSSTTSYNTSSDYRLKENIADITDATTRLKQLQPKRFNFITDADTTVDGFIAHEVSSIVPEAVTGEKDAVNEDGSIKPQGIDQSKLVPVLTKALQEAITKIEELETRIQTLENA